MKTKQFLLKTMIQRYIHNHLIDHLGGNKDEYVVESIPTWLGTSKFFIKTDERSVVARFYPFTKRRASRRFLNASRLVEKMGAPLSPKIIFSDLTLKTLFWYGLSLVVVERVYGEGFERFKGEREVLSNIAKTLASLNTIQRDRPGEIWEKGGNNYYHRYLTRCVWDSLGRIERYLAPLGQRKRELYTWFYKECKNVCSQKSFWLSHPKFTPDDILIGEDKRVYLLDLDDVQFGSFGFDLVWSLFSFCSNDDEREFFTKVYFGHAPHNYKPYWDSHKNFYYAWYCLDNAGGLAKKAVRVRECDYDSYVEFQKRARGLFEDLCLYI